MRTTLSLDPDVAAILRQRTEDSSQSLKQVVNQALRIGLAATAPSEPQPFRVEPHAFAMRPGIDPDKLNQLLDEWEVEAHLGR
jgi:hypothetical protein